VGPFLARCVGGLAGIPWFQPVFCLYSRIRAREPTCRRNTVPIAPHYCVLLLRYRSTTYTLREGDTHQLHLARVEMTTPRFLQRRRWLQPGVPISISCTTPGLYQCGDRSSLRVAALDALLLLQPLGPSKAQPIRTSLSGLPVTGALLVTVLASDPSAPVGRTAAVPRLRAAPDARRIRCLPRGLH
jgi:hypothetical protein